MTSETRLIGHVDACTVGQAGCRSWRKELHLSHRSARGPLCVPVSSSRDSLADVEPHTLAAKAPELVDLIHSHGMRAAVAISPHTPASAISTSLGQKVDMLLVMTVVPGAGGQKFMRECVPKVSELRERFPEKDIQVDGGVGPGTVGCCARAGELRIPLVEQPAAGRRGGARVDPRLVLSYQARMSSSPAPLSSAHQTPSQSLTTSRSKWTRARASGAQRRRSRGCEAREVRRVSQSACV